jgi:hypothetical protein
MAAIKRADLNHVRVAEEPNWLTGDLGKYPEADFFKLTTAFRTSGGSQLQVTGPLQQSDLLRPLLMDIARHGLAYAYNKYTRVHGIRSDATDGPVQQTNNPKHVIIVGAGMAGLVAAHELVRVGHKVTIVETQDRVGGRVKTISHDGGAETKTHKQRGEFAPKLYCEGKYMYARKLLSHQHASMRIASFPVHRASEANEGFHTRSGVLHENNREASLKFALHI